jgi:hypothetical protein
MEPLIWKKAFFILVAVVGIFWFVNLWQGNNKSAPVIIINAPTPTKVGEPSAPFTLTEAPLGFTEVKPVSPSTPYSYMGAPDYGTRSEGKMPLYEKRQIAMAPHAEPYTTAYTLKDMIPLYKKRQLSMSPYFEPYIAPSE